MRIYNSSRAMRKRLRRKSEFQMIWLVCGGHVSVLNIGVRAIFYQGGGGGGGAVNHLPKKFSQVAQIFTKKSKRNEGHIRCSNIGLLTK